jgi:hypothetical protein
MNIQFLKQLTTQLLFYTFHIFTTKNLYYSRSSTKKTGLILNNQTCSK